MADYTIYVFAGTSDRPNDPEVLHRRSNQIRLGGVYGAWRQRYAMAVDVPKDLLSASAQRMVEAMEGDFTGGPIRLSMPRPMIRRRRIGLDEAATILGFPSAAASVWIESYGPSVGNAVVREDLADDQYPTAASTSTLATELNRLARRPGLVILMPETGEELVIDPSAAAIDETIQAQRWKHLLKRGMSSVA